VVIQQFYILDNSVSYSKIKCFVIIAEQQNNASCSVPTMQFAICVNDCAQLNNVASVTTLNMNLILSSVNIYMSFKTTILTILTFTEISKYYAYVLKY